MSDLFSVAWETRPRVPVYYRNRIILRNRLGKTVLAAYGARTENARALLIQMVVHHHGGNGAMMTAIRADAVEGGR